MEIIQDIFSYQASASMAVAIGKFDGIHEGHQEIIKRVLNKKEEGLLSCVVTFDRPLTQDHTGILSQEEKRANLEKLGVDFLVKLPANKEMFSMEAKDFVNEILLKRLHTKYLCAGRDFRFGKDRKGDISFLQDLARNNHFQVEVLEKLQYKEEDISSSRIRSLLTVGKMEEITLLLGRPYEVTAEVIHGKELGRTIGIPTINQRVLEGKILPAHGAYASRVHVDNQSYPGVTNVGIRPSIEDGEALSIETHIIGYRGDLYGREVKVEFLKFLRPEKKFSSLEELIKQIHEDIEQSKEMYSSSRSL